MEKKPNTGALFDSDSSIHKEGSIDINGNKHRVLIKKYNQDGKDNYALYVQLGYMNINTNKGDNQKRPDWLGNLKYNTFDHNLSGWENISQNQKKYISLNVKMKTDDDKKGNN